MGSWIVTGMFIAQAMVGAYVLSFYLVPWMGGRRNEP